MYHVGGGGGDRRRFPLLVPRELAADARPGGRIESPSPSSGPCLPPVAPLMEEEEDWHLIRPSQAVQPCTSVAIRTARGSNEKKFEKTGTVIVGRAKYCF